MVLTKKDTDHLNELVKRLNAYCDENEKVKPYLAYYKDGYAEIEFELFWEGKLITRGSYSEIYEYIRER